MTGAPAAALLLVASVIGTEGAGFQVDLGLIDGLRPGDRGHVYYELKIGEAVRRVDVGSALVARADDLGAELEAEGEAEIRPGYLVEFQVSAERVAPAEVLRLARQRLEEGQFDEIAERMLENLIPADPEMEDRVIRWLEARRAARETVAPEAGPEPRIARAKAVRIPAGSYLVGLPAERAQYFNQQPQFRIRAREFRIDERPVSRAEFLATRPGFSFPGSDPEAPATGVPYDLAEEHCRERGERLPTEFQWEIAAQTGEILFPEALLEWTSSWYKPYPGNSRGEETYGERYRVLRGASSAVDPERHRRRYMSPAQGNPRVGFRCAELEDGPPG